MTNDPKTQGMFFQLIEALLRFGAVLGSVSMWLIGAIVCLDVVLRYLGHPSLWALEVSTYLMIGVATFGSGLAVLKRDHFAVDIFPEALSARPRAALAIFTNLVCLGLLTFVAYGFWRLMQLSLKLDMKSATLLKIPLIIPQTAVFFGFALMALAFLHQLFSRKG